MSQGSVRMYVPSDFFHYLMHIIADWVGRLYQERNVPKLLVAVIRNAITHNTAFPAVHAVSALLYLFKKNGSFLSPSMSLSCAFCCFVSLVEC